MKAITHSRRNFYQGRPIYWYQFLTNGGNLTVNSFLDKFIRVPDTKYYEYGGSYEESIKELTNSGITDIVEGKEL